MTEWNAPDYVQVSALQKWLADTSLAGLSLAGDERVLDVGCGDGRITAEIADRLPRGSVLGVDASHDMIRFADRQLAARPRANLAFQVADAAALGFGPEFDLVVSFNALHWVRAQEAALRGIREALRPGGAAFLQLVPRGARTALEEVIERTRHAARWESFFGDAPPPYLHLAPEAYAELAVRAGFAVERVERQQREWDFGSRAAFERFAEATFVEWTRHLPAERHAEFIHEVLDAYGGLAADEPGRANVFSFAQMEVTLRRP
jgi:trans-aconitate 2-methyltransferase